MSSISLCRYVHVFPVFYDKTIIEKKKEKKKEEKKEMEINDIMG